MRDVATRRSPRGPLVEEVEAHVGDAAAVLKALGNEQRLLVLCTLMEGPRSVGEIHERMTLSQSALSQHLAVLRTAGIVVTRREAQTIYYSVAPGPANEVMRALYDAYCAPARAQSRRRQKLRSVSKRQPKESKP